MNEIATIAFTDAGSGSEGFLIIRSGGGLIALCITLMENGDAEAVFGQSECRRLIAVLQTALTHEQS